MPWSNDRGQFFLDHMIKQSLSILSLLFFSLFRLSTTAGTYHLFRDSVNYEVEGIKGWILSMIESIIPSGTLKMIQFTSHLLLLVVEPVP